MNLFFNETEDTAKFSMGILVMENVQNQSAEDKLKHAREELESTIRSKYSQANREELKALHPMDAYVLYYKKFGYTYHVLQQFESVIKNKPIPVGLPSVDAMFLGELKNMILTAGHDLDKIKAPLSLRVAEGSESYTSLSGRTVMTIPNDIMIADQEGVISSILRGPDLQTAITARTTRVIYTVYAPPEVEEQLVSNHLKDIEAYVKIVSEKSVTRLSRVFGG